MHIFNLLQIMEETNTFVTWPSRLKIGAKSKKGKTAPAQIHSLNHIHIACSLFIWRIEILRDSKSYN